METDAEAGLEQLIFGTRHCSRIVAHAADVSRVAMACWKIRRRMAMVEA
jgi:hypothetical protein